MKGKISREELDSILEPLWDLVYEAEKTSDSILWIIDDAIEENDWTHDEYFDD